MANVSQKIQTFLGGVSRKADFDKIQGQVVEANNCYPDETYGMIKRPGTELLGTLGIDFATANDTYFFPIIREGRPRYLCGLSSGSIRVWSLDNPSTPITVNTPDGTSYLNYNNINNIIQSQAYRAASDDRRTVIVNRTVLANELTNKWSDETEGFEWSPRGHKRSVNSIEDLPQGEVLKVNWGDGGETTVQSNPLRPGIHYLPTSVAPNKIINNPDGTTTEVVQPTKGAGCVLKCNIDANGAIIFKGAYRTNADGEEYFAEYQGPNTGWTDQTGDIQIYDASVWSKGSNYPDQCELNVDGVDGSSCSTATGLLPAYVHRVVHSGADDDDSYFQAFGNFDKNDVPPPGDEPDNHALVSGPYVWKECPSPDSYVGLDASTLPHELIEEANGTFTFQKVDYSNRWAGDNKNNPSPSFTGSYINNVFFLNNRLGFLSEDNVILSRPINYGPPGVQPNRDIVPDDNPWVQRNYYEIDFFRQSAIGLNDADPIDIKAANNDTSIFHTAIATPQGTILFADGQQSLLFQPQGLLSPLTASINSLSNYDMTGDVNAVIVGEKYYFVNKSDKFCRIYSMINQGMQNPPVIEDITKEVADWLPNDMTDLVACPTDNMIFVFNRVRNEVYARREIGEGSSWVKWRHSHPVVSLVVDHDLIFFMTSSDTDIQVSVARLYLLPDDYTLGENQTVYDTSEFTSIPENYNYYNSIVGNTSMAGNYQGVIEYYKPWHSYYGDLNVNSSLDDTFNKWLPWEDNTPVSALISVSADETGASEEYPWNVMFKIAVRSTEGSTVYSPSAGSYFLPYDTKFRLRNISGPPNDTSYDSTVVRCDTTPIHTGTTPPPYDRVRYVGRFTTDDANNSIFISGSDPVTGGAVYVSPWITPDSAWTGDTGTGYTGDPYLYIGGTAFRVGGASYNESIVDHWFDPNSNNHLSQVDTYTPWVNYRSPHAPDNNNNTEFGSYSSNGQISIPWRSKASMSTNDIYNSIHGNTHWKLGGIGGYGFTAVQRYAFETALVTWYFFITHTGVANTTTFSTIDGYWEFEKDGDITRWAGYDVDGTLRTTLPIISPCSDPDPLTAPPDYDEVRFVGTFSSTNSNTTLWSGLSPVSGSTYVSDWYTKDVNASSNYLYIGGAFFHTDSTGYSSGPLRLIDNYFPAINSGATNVSYGLPSNITSSGWVNYISTYNNSNYPSMPAGANYGTYPTDAGIQWRSQTTLTTTGGVWPIYHGFISGRGLRKPNNITVGEFNDGDDIGLSHAVSTGEVTSSITGYWQFRKNGVITNWAGYDASGNLRTDTPWDSSPVNQSDPCCNDIWIQNTDGTEYNTGIQAKSFEVIPDGDEVIVKYVPCSTSTFDPLQYTYVRYVGRLTNSNEPVYANQYGLNIGLFLSDDGSIVTNWKLLGTNQTYPKTAYFVGSAYVRENSYPYYYYPAETYLGSSPFTDSAGTLTYPTINEAWRANVTVTNTGNDSTSSTIFVGDIGAYNGSSIAYSPNPDSGGAFGAPDFRGGIYRNTVTTVKIKGKWEFTNDTSEGTQVTWGGINDGISSTDFEFTRRYPSSTFKTAYLRIVPTECCGCPTEPVPPIILNTLSLDPNMDLYTTNVTVSGTTVTPPASFPKLTSQKMAYVIANLPGSTAVASDRAGDTGTLTWNSDHTLTADTDLTNYANSLIIGYRFDYHLVLPTFYFNQGNSDFDYTASLTVSRVKFALGLSGQADFEINVRNGPGWESSYSQVISNEYLASTAPLSKPAIVSVPVHKRNSDFQLQVKSDSPFPLSVDSCMWEGNYSPRYYRRT